MAKLYITVGLAGIILFKFIKNGFIFIVYFWIENQYDSFLVSDQEVIRVIGMAFGSVFSNK